jgi:NADH-quinone oxidoreductase subunit L
MPWTAGTFFIATLAIAGVPGLSGFFSKDEILFSAYRYGYNDHPWALLVWIVGLATALLTAIYMGRCYWLTFERAPRWPSAMDVKPHESPLTMTIPLIVLAALSLGGGLLGLPEVLGESWIHHWLVAEGAGPVHEPALELAVSHGVEWGLLALGGTLGLVGLLIGYLYFGRRGPNADVRLRQRLGWLYRAASRKWFWDDVYDDTVVRGTVGSARNVLEPFDRRVVDGAVNGTAGLVQRAAGALRGIQTGVVQSYALAVVLGTVIVVALMLFV